MPELSIAIEQKIGALAHGLSGSPEYKAWSHMKTRCQNSKYDKFQNYGGRGISVCPQWAHDFMSFYLHVGPRPGAGYSLDRINNNQDYEPGNVRWATAGQQAVNKRNTLLAIFGGVERPISEVCRENGFKRRLVTLRKSLGYSDDQLFMPPHSLPRRKRGGPL